MSSESTSAVSRIPRRRTFLGLTASDRATRSATGQKRRRQPLFAPRDTVEDPAFIAQLRCGELRKIPHGVFQLRPTVTQPGARLVPRAFTGLRHTG